MIAAPSVAARTDLEALLARYLEVLEGERNLSRFTLRNYRTDLSHYFTYLSERDIDPLAVTRVLFRGYLAAMQQDGVAQGSVSRRVSTAKSFYRWLRLTGVMRDDPLAAVRGPKQAKRLPHVMTLENITSLIAAADGSKPAELRDRALLESMYASGVRISEAAGLDLGDVDLDALTMIVRGKGNKQRLVVMGEPARAAFARYLRDGRPALIAGGRQHRQIDAETTGRERRRSSARTGDESSPSAVFINRNGTRLSQRRIQLIVKKYALAAGIEARVHPHLLRHTFATHLLDGGAELRVVQELMGHSNPNTTQIYLHVTEERQRSVVEGSLDELAGVEIARRALARERKRSDATR